MHFSNINIHFFAVHLLILFSNPNIKVVNTKSSNMVVVTLLYSCCNKTQSCALLTMVYSLIKHVYTSHRKNL